MGNNDFTPKGRTWIWPCHCTAGFGAFPSSANLLQTLWKHRHCWHSESKTIHSVTWPHRIYWPTHLEHSLFSLNTAHDDFVISKLMKRAVSGKSSPSTANTAFDASGFQIWDPSSSSLSLPVSLFWFCSVHSGISVITVNHHGQWASVNGGHSAAWWTLLLRYLDNKSINQESKTPAREHAQKTSSDSRSSELNYLFLI